MGQPHRLHELIKLQATLVVEDRARLVIESVLGGDRLDTAIRAWPCAFL